MSTTYTSRLKLGIPAVADRLWNVPLTANLNAIEAQNPIGALSVTPAEIPSASLNVSVAAGAIVTPWGQVVSYSGTATKSLSAASTSYLWLTMAGVLTVGSAWPSTPYVPLAVVTTDSGTVTATVDSRIVFPVIVPASQPTFGVKTAASSYSTNEQTMLQTLWNAWRTLQMGT